jgi:hypothetical protein
MNNFPGRNDHIHGDEHYFTDIPETDVNEVLKAIADNKSDAYGWIKRLGRTDALYHLSIIICKGRDKPEYRELVEALKIEIEGWL